jgi:hypothetical protein
VSPQQGLNLTAQTGIAGAGLLKELLALGWRTELERAGKNVFGGTGVSHGRRSAKTFRSIRPPHFALRIDGMKRHSRNAGKSNLRPVRK